MTGHPRFLGLHAKPGRWPGIVLALLPFILLGIVYAVASDVRHVANEADKLLPTLGKMIEAIHQYAFTPNPRSGEYLLWADTLASLQRLVIGVSLAAAVGLVLGLNMGLLPGIRGLLLPLTTVLSIVPPLSVLPILFICFGVDELAKVMLIFIGTVFIISRDMYRAAASIPVEQVTKALTLGAGPCGVLYRVILPQMMPRLFEAVRLVLGAAWLFLIAAEAIASTDGLGYRIFLVRRYMAMDVIIPYVLWITFLGFAIDRLIKAFIDLRYRWYVEGSR